MILLDTHIVWWLAYEPHRLSQQAAEAIRARQFTPNALAISAVTLYELAWLLEKGRLRISVAASVFLGRVEQQFAILPVTGLVAVGTAGLPATFQSDAMDRIIVATAIVTGRTLVSVDGGILSANLCKTVS